MSQEQLLRTEGLVKKYHKRCVVNHVDININTNEIVGLLGPNGAGKTTTFYMAVGLIRANDGKVFFCNDEVTHLSMSERARKGIGYLAQEPSVFRKLTVEDNIMAILETLDLSKNQRKERLSELLHRMNIEHLSKQYAYTLSGGERRRLEIARSLVTQPKFLMLDEPFSGVDPIAVAEVQEIIKGLRDEGMGILLTDHNVRETLLVTDRTYLMYEGRVLIHGNAKELADDPQARRLYLGESFSF